MVQGPRMKTRVLCIVVAVYLPGCIGTVDGVIKVKGSVTDIQSRPYERCRLTLYEVDGEDPLNSRIVTGREFLTTLHVPTSRWRGVEIGVSCDGAKESFRSERIGPFSSPVDLGMIKLPRAQGPG